MEGVGGQTSVREMVAVGGRTRKGEERVKEKGKGEERRAGDEMVTESIDDISDKFFCEEWQRDGTLAGRQAKGPGQERFGYYFFKM